MQFILLNIVALFLLVACSEQKTESISENQEESKKIDGMLATEREEVKKLFSKMQALTKNYDASYVDLYSDEAIIRNKRFYPNGKQREMTFPAPKYKKIIRSVMPIAKQRGDWSSYRKIKYSKEGDRFIIEAIRYSHLKKYESPYKLVLNKDENGELKIIEEYSESKPFGGH